MGRGKLPLRLIPKERARRITFAKRKRGLLKKAYELSTLCDVKVCVIVYDTTNTLSPECPFHHHHDHHQKQQQQQQQHVPLYTWPEEPQEVESIIAKYLAYKAKNPVSKKDLDLTDFFKEKIKKIKHETKRLAVENKIKNIMMMKHRRHHNHHDQFDFLWDNRIDGFSLTQLHNLMTHLDKRISEADKHWTDLHNKNNNNLMIMCVAPHDKYYNDVDNHHHDHQSNHQFGSTSTAVSPLKMMLQDHHMGNSFQATPSDHHHDHNYNINNNQVVFIPQYDYYYNINNPQYNYSWGHDHQPAASSSAKTVPFDHHSSGSFTTMMLNSYDQTDHNEDSDQQYNNPMNIGTTMFNNNDSATASANIISGMSSANHDHIVIRHQSGVFFNNHNNVALQPYMPLFGGSAAHGSGYSPAGSQLHGNNSQQDVKFCDNQLHGLEKLLQGSV